MANRHTSGRKPAILSEAGAHSEWIVRPFLDAGLEIDRCTVDEVPARLATGTYNVLVLGRYYVLYKTKQELDRIFAELEPAMRGFLAQEGGIFYSYPSGLVGPYREMLAPYDVAFRELGITDPETAVYDGLPEHQRQYAYTTRVSGPVADGVDGVWYVARWGTAWGTRPVEAPSDKGWQVVLSGSPASRTEPLPGDYATPVTDGAPEGYDGFVPLMALRDFGPGRMAVCGIPSGYHFSSPHTFPTGRRLLTEGFHNKPSGMQRLLVNTMRWLAQPSLTAGTLGGATSPDTILRPDVRTYPPDPPVTWAEREFPAHGEPMRGLIGARTAYTTGRGTVAEYVAKAKEAGLDFIVFLEDFKALDDAKLAALKQDCLAHTTDTFFAVPGLTLEDEAGNHTFHYGYQVAPPKPDLLSPDGTILQHDPNGTARNRRLDCVHSAYMFGELECRCRNGTYRHAENGMRFWDLRCCDSIALVTWENGQVVDDLRHEYRALEDLGMLLAPTVLTFMNGPDELDAARASGWRNMVIEPYATLRDRVLIRNMARELEWWGFSDEQTWNTPQFRFDNWQCSWPFQYMTSGPEIAAWSVSASGRSDTWRVPDTEVPDCADWFRADLNGFRLRIKVTSDKGLREVRLVDGRRPVRRWQCNGVRVFEHELDLVNSQQLNLLVEADDVDGGSAVTQDFHTQRLDWGEFFCADRNNQLCLGYEKDADGTAFGWTGTMYLAYNNGQWGGVTPSTGRWWYEGDAMHPVPGDPVHDETNPCDGGVTNAGAGLHVMVQMPPLDPPELGFMLTPRRELISTDVAIGAMVVDSGFDPDWPNFHGQEITGWSWFPVHETRYLHLGRRAVVFRPRPRSLTTMVYEWNLRWKQDPGLGEPLRVGWLDADASHVLHRADGTREPMAGRDSRLMRTTWGPDEYVVSWTDGRRPAIFINQGVPIDLVRDETEGKRLALDIPPERLQKKVPGTFFEGRSGASRGQSRDIKRFQEPFFEGTSIRVIGVGGTYEHRDPDVAGKMCEAMGLCGEPAYRVELEAGHVVSQRLLLVLDAARRGSALRIPQADLPMALPVVVENLNDNWPVFLVDRDARRWRPLGVLDGTAYATVDTGAQDWNLFLGHPVTASDAAVVLSLTQISPDRWVLEVHNPTERDVTVEVEPSEWFTLLDWGGATVDLPAGTSTFETLRAKPDSST